MTGVRLIVSGPTETKDVLLDPKGVNLGRGSNCDVILNDSCVSRLHARIYQDPFGRWIVEDLDSQNGVLIDGQQIMAQAVLPNQKIEIRPFTLHLFPESGKQLAIGQLFHGIIPVVDKGSDEQIVSYRGDQASVLSPALMQHLNEFTISLLKLSNPSELYSQACICLAEVLDTLVAIVRLPCRSEPMPASPDILACHFGGGQIGADILQRTYLHFSKRVLDAARSIDSPVMGSSRPSPDQDIELTIIDEYKPHLVFSACINDMGHMVDVLYIDILEAKSPSEMFDFVEAVARQINFAQKNLFLVELRKQEKALREANTQLKEKDHIKDEYVSRVTHDIKGHLAAIQSCLCAAADESPESLNETQFGFLSRALNRTIQLTDFVRELLHLTQMRLSGQSKMEPFSLHDCIYGALSSVASKAKEKSITVTSDIESSLGHIVGDEFSINEMFTNLLFNAVKYTPENKSVHLEAKDKGDHVQIDISDRGIGIPSDELGHIFEEFFRASNARQREKDGTGLGLSIVKQIVERHGGEISVQSKQDQGTIFTVKLPKNYTNPVCS